VGIRDLFTYDGVLTLYKSRNLYNEEWMNVNDKFSYEHKASRPLRDRLPTTLGAVTRKSVFRLLWTSLVKKRIIYIVAK
jgi:hypothetical protein